MDDNTEDPDVIAKHIAKANNTTSQTDLVGLKIYVKVTQKGACCYAPIDTYEREVTLPLDMMSSYLGRLKDYLTTQ